MNEPNENKHTDTENQGSGYQGDGGRGRAKWVKGVHSVGTDGN